MRPVRLRGRGVAKRFGHVDALRGIDFDIAPGEAVSVLGANGAGKSTLLRILAGLSRPTSGDFQAFHELRPESDPQATPTDRESAPLPRETLRGDVGYVGHATLLYGELTAAENLLFAGRLAGGRPSPARLAALLESVGLADVADRRAGTFSRGMSQRLAIARAIVHEPAVLLLDEPFTGLDEGSAQALRAQLEGLRADGRTLLLITHDPRRAVELCDRALVLHRGQLIATPGRRAEADAPGSGSRDGEDAFEVESLREILARAAATDAGQSAA